MILFKIAYRNLRAHPRKTLMVGALMTLGTTVLVLGNSLMTTITQGLEASFVENYTGDLIVRDAREPDAEFFAGFGEAPTTLQGYDQLAESLGTVHGIVRFTPLLSSAAVVGVGDDLRTFALLWGIEPSSYFAMFPGRFVLREGHLLRDDEEGILLAQAVADDIQDHHGVALAVGDTVLLTDRNDVTGTKVRAVTIRGIGTYANAVGPLARISFVDASTLRTLAGLTAVRTARGAGDAVSAPAVSEDALFGAPESFVRAPMASGNDTVEAIPDFDRLLGDTSARARALALDNDAWHFVLLGLAEGASPAAVAGQIHASGRGAQDVLVEDWRWGAGLFAEFAAGVRTVINAVIVVTAWVAMIIITNALVISVTERVAEIGTVRAIGGQKSFVRTMIMVEVLMIVVAFGAIGAAIGSAVVGLLHLVGIQTTNHFLQVLFGGTALHPILTVRALGAAIAAVAVIGTGASLYPASVALRIPPVRAMQRA